MFSEGNSFCTYRGSEFVLLLILIFVLFFFFQDVWEIFTSSVLCHLTLKDLTWWFSLKLLYLSSLFLPWLQFPIHSAEQILGMTSFPLLLLMHVCRIWLLSSDVISTATEMLHYFSHGFTSYWKPNYSNVSKIKKEGIIRYFWVCKSYGCYMLISQSS